MTHARFCEELVRRPVIVIAVAGAMAVAAAILLARFRVDPNIEHLLPKDDPTLRLTRQLQGASPPSRVLFVVLRGSEVEKQVPTAAGALRPSPHVAAVHAERSDFGELPHPSAWPDEALDRLEKRLTTGRREALEDARRRLAEDPLAGKETVLRDPLGVRWVLTDLSPPFKLKPGSPYVTTGDLAILRVIGRQDSFDTDFSRAIVQDLRARLSPLPVEVELAGGYASAVAQEAAMRRDMQVESIASAVAVLLFVWWYTKSFLAAHLVFVPIVLSIAMAVGLGGAILGPLTPLVAAAAAILVAQGIDFPMHLFCRYRARRAADGRDAALAGSMAEMGRPFLGIAATTIAAFLALQVSRFPGLREFGIVITIGLALCLVTALYLFPVLLRPADRFVRPATERVPMVVAAAHRVHGNRLVAVGIVVLGLAAWALVLGKGVRMDLDVRSTIAPGDPGMAALDRLEKDLGLSLQPVYALVPPGDDVEPKVEALGLPMHEVPRGPSARWAAFRERTAGWLEATREDLRAVGFRPEPFEPALRELDARLSAPVPPPQTVDGRWVVRLHPEEALWGPEARAAFDAKVRDALGPVELYSAFHMPDHYARVLGEDLVRVSLLTGLAVAVLTVLAVGNVRMGIRAWVPVVLSTGMTLAAVVLMGGRINLINMAAIPITVAIGVDGGLHFMVRARELWGRDPRQAILDVGPGVWGSAATTVLGFGAIAFSVTPGMAQMGVLVTIGALTSVLSTLFLLPSIVK